MNMLLPSALQACFWNQTENRLRAGWRLLLQLSLNLGGALVFTRLVAPHTPLASWPRLALEALGYPVLLGITLASVWLAGRFLDRRSWQDFGLNLAQRLWWLDCGAGFAVGFTLVVLVMASATALGLVRLELTFTSGIAGLAFPAATLLAVLSYSAVGLFEELARAYQMRNLFEAFRGTRLGLAEAAWLAAGGAALVSVTMHSGSAFFMVYVFISITIQGLFYFLTSRIALIVGYHVAWDFALATIFGIEALTQAEHTGLFTPHLLEIVQVGAAGLQVTDWPRLALAGLVALVLQLSAWLALLGWVRWQTGELRIRPEMNRPTAHANLSPGTPRSA